MTDDATQDKVRLTDGLGPLPPPNEPPVFGYTSADMRAYAAEAVAAERERSDALRQFAEHVRAHGDTRLASMAIAVLNATKANGA